jgi:hypothetical protein
VETTEPPSVLEQIENSMRAAGRQGRDAVKLDAFELFIAAGALDHLSFAVPLLPNPDDWAPHVAALTETFDKRGKRPRLEYIEELHPGLGPALEQAGLHCEMRAPIMVLELATLPAAEEQQSGRISAPGPGRRGIPAEHTCSARVSPLAARRTKGHWIGCRPCAAGCAVVRSWLPGWCARVSS